MRLALAEADAACAEDEVPIGAVVVFGDTVVGRGHNRPVRASDPTAHAEMLALREAAATVGNYRLTGTTLYVTVEPCLMCLGAIIHARVGTLVYGVPEPKSGAVESAPHGSRDPLTTSGLVVVSGVLAAECRDRVLKFFQQRR
jgi:tRNA(adenine34) deaminase